MLDTNLGGKVAPGTVHLRDVHPLARPGTVALPSVHARHTVEAAERVQALIVGDDAHAAAPVVHGGDEGPLGGRRVEVLSRVQTLLAVEAPAYKDLSWAINTGGCGNSMLVFSYSGQNAHHQVLFYLSLWLLRL